MIDQKSMSLEYAKALWDCIPYDFQDEIVKSEIKSRWRVYPTWSTLDAKHKLTSSEKLFEYEVTDEDSTHQAMVGNLWDWIYQQLCEDREDNVDISILVRDTLRKFADDVDKLVKTE